MKHTSLLLRQLLDRPFIFLAASVLVLVVALTVLFRTYLTIQDYAPRFDFVLDMEAPTEAGSIQLYINQQWATPYSVPINPTGKTLYTFRGIPNHLKHIRLDPGHRAGITVKFRALSIIAVHSSLGPDEVISIHEFDVTTWKDLTLFNIDAEGNSLHVKTSGPMILGGMDFDLPAMVSGWPQPPTITFIFLWLAVAFTIAGVVGMVLAFVIGWKCNPRIFSALALAKLSLAGFSITIISSFPGHTNFDEFYSLNEALTNVLSDIHPPLQTVSWLALINLAEIMGLGSNGQHGSMLVVQSLLFWAAALILAMAFRNRWLGAVFLISIFVMPQTLSYLGHIGKDSQIAIALLIAVTMIFMAVNSKSYVILAASILPLIYGFSVRSNGMIAVVPLACLWGFALAWIRESRNGIQVSWTRVTGVSILLFVGLFTINMLISQTFVKNKCCFAHAGFMTLVHDMMGISVRTEKNYIPSYLYSKSDYSLKDIKVAYAPIWTYSFNGLRTIHPEDHKKILGHWKDVVLAHPLEYLQHRWGVIRSFIGFNKEPYYQSVFAGTFRSTNVRSDTLSDKLRYLVKNVDTNILAFRIKKAFISYFHLLKNSVLFRPWVYLIVTISAYLFLGGLGTSLLVKVSNFIGISNALYFFAYFPLTSNASFRYLIWSLIASILAIFIRLDETISTPVTVDMGHWRERLRQKLIPPSLVRHDGRIVFIGMHQDIFLFFAASGLLYGLAEAGLYAGL